MMTFWKPERTGRQLRFALFAALFFLPVSWYRGAHPITSSGPVQPSTYRIHLNRAQAAELTLIPGIGPRLAEAIVQHREKEGPFRRIGDLEKVGGLGPVKTSVIKQWILHDDRGELPQPHK